MENQNEIAVIKRKIIELPDRPPAILDRDLAFYYGTTAKYLNKQIKNHLDWFDTDYFFRLSKEEVQKLNLYSGGFLPIAYTHDGCNAAAFVINSYKAKQHRKLIIHVFTELEKQHFHGIAMAQDLREFEDIAKDAACWRLKKNLSHTTLSEKEFKNFMRYRELDLRQWEIAKLLDRVPSSISLYEKMVRESIKPIQKFFEIKTGQQLLLDVVR